MADIPTTDSSDSIALTTPNGNDTEDYSQRDGCYGYLPTNTLFLYLSVPSFVFIIIGSFLKKRKQRMLNCCGGRPAMMQPLDTLNPHPSRRVAYAAAFGMTTQLCLNLFIGAHLPPQFEEKVSINGINIGSIFRIICVVIYTIAIYPIFAAIYENSIFGYAVATLYAWLIFGMEIFNIVYCIPDMKQDLADAAPDNVNEDDFVRKGLPLYLSGYFIRLLPQFAYELYLAFSLPARFIRCIIRRSKKTTDGQMIQKDVKRSPGYIHVKAIFAQKPKELTGHSDHPPLKIRIRDYFFPPASGYRYSVRVICTFVVAATTIYMVGFDNIFDFVDKTSQWDQSMENFEDELGSGQVQAALSLLGGFLPIPLFDSEGQSDIKGTYRVFKISFIVAQTMAMLTALLSIFFSIAAVRNDMVAVYKGKFEKIPSRDVLAGPSLVVGSLKYSGLQIAYLVWGYLVHFATFFGIGMIIGLVTLWEGIWELLLNVLKEQWVTILTMILLIVFQIVMAKFVLTQEQQVALNNRKFYFNLIYIMFFYNIVVGLFSCLLRIVKSMIIGIIFLPRLDQSSMPERFEMQDPGFSAYVGYIHIENAHTNPVLLMFCYFLTRSSGTQSKTRSQHYITRETAGTSDDVPHPAKIQLNMPQRKEMIRRRYWLWFTLHQNPSVRLLRKHKTEETPKLEHIENTKATETA